MKSLKEKIFDEISRGGGTSFVELSWLEGFNGDHILHSKKSEYIVFWANVSKEALLALQELESEKKIKMTATSPLVYLADGKVLKLPILKSKRLPKKPHWLPTVYNALR